METAKNTEATNTYVTVIITDNMIEAGVAVLKGSGRLPYNIEDWAVRGLAADVYRAMSEPRFKRPTRRAGR